MTNPLSIVMILLLAAGLIVISIFWGSMQPVASQTNQQGTCSNSLAVSCKTTGVLPSAWREKAQNGISCWEATSALIVNGTGSSCADYGL